MHYFFSLKGRELYHIDMYAYMGYYFAYLYFNFYKAEIIFYAVFCGFISFTTVLPGLIHVVLYSYS